MITETTERPATAEERYNLSKKEFEAAYTAEIDYLNQRLKAVENDEEVIDIITNLESTNMTYTMLCFSLPYYQKYFEWEITAFTPPFVQPDELEQAISVMDRGLEDSAVQAYINLKYKDDAQYIKTILNCVDTPPKATKPLTEKEKKLFTIYLEQVFKPAFLDFLENVKQNKYRPFKDILEELKELLPIFQEVRNNINHKAEILKAEIYRSKNDLTALIMQYAEKSGFLDKLSSKTEGKKKPADTVATPFEISPYSLVLSNQFARNVMLMNTSRPLEKKSLLDSSVQIFAPKLREEGIDGITQIAIDTEQLGDITATWGTTEKRLLAMYNEAICKDGAKTREVVINVNDYMKRCNLSVSNKKETVKELKKAIDRMHYTSLIFEDGESKANFALFEATAYHNGNIFIKGTDIFVTAMTGGKGGRNVMHLPAEYYTCKGKNAVSAMNVIQTLCYHQGNYNNVKRSMMFENRQNEHYKISSLLKKTEITTIEKVRETRQSWKSKIKEPLEAILNDFPGANNWGYIINGKPRLPEELPQDITYEKWENLTIQYNIENFPNERVIQGIEAKEAKREEARQILADQAAVAREREQKRKSRKKKAATSNS